MKLEKVNQSYKIFTNNNKEINGSFELDIDGFYYFWFREDSKGWWTAHTLREIADKLDEVNASYSKSIEEYFKTENEKAKNCKHEFERITDFTQSESFLCKKCGLEVFHLENENSAQKE